MASIVDFMDSTPRTMGGSTRSSLSRMTTSSIFQEAKPGAMIWIRYLPGETSLKEKTPLGSDCVERKVLSSVFSRLMLALETVASWASVMVPEMTDVLGASGSCGDEVDAGCCALRFVLRRSSAQ